MRLSINLATRPFADLGPAIKRLRIAMAVLALIAIGLGLGLRAFHQKADEARARDHSLDSDIARITRERQDYQNLMRRPENVQLMQQVGALNQLFDEKTFSWTLAMEDLEVVLPGGVQASTLEPVRAKDGTITLRLRVIGPRDKAVELVRNLEHSRHFLLPRIVGENSESSGSPGEKLEPISASNRVNFDLLADYNPAVPLGLRKSEVIQKQKAEKTAAEISQNNLKAQEARKPSPASAAASRSPLPTARTPLVAKPAPPLPFRMNPTPHPNLLTPNATPQTQTPNAGGPR